MRSRIAALATLIPILFAACSKDGDSQETRAPQPSPLASEANAGQMPHGQMPPGHPHGQMPPGHGQMMPGHGHGQMPPGHPSTLMPAGHGAGGAAANVADDGTVTLGPIQMKAPTSWKSVAPKTNMRAAQFEIPGDAGAAELVVYYFGTSGAGGLEANLQRWYRQFEQADGSSTADKAKTEKRKVSGLDVTTVDVSGRYVARMRPGAEARHDQADYRMLAAIIETQNGPYYLKLIGPQKTVAAAQEPFDAMIASIETK